MVADLDEAERANEQINELREKAIILKNLKMIEKNERAVDLISSRNSVGHTIRKSKTSTTSGSTHCSS